MTQIDELVELDELYQEIVLDHCRHPRNEGALEAPDFTARVDNPFCGDAVAVDVGLDGERIAHVRIMVEGCSVTKASASMMTELVQGKDLDQVETLHRLFKDMTWGKGLTPYELEQIKPLDAFMDIRRFPIRIKCVLLAWMALEEGIKLFRDK